MQEYEIYVYYVNIKVINNLISVRVIIIIIIINIIINEISQHV